MLDFPRWKVLSLWGLVALGILFAIPSLLPGNIAERYGAWLPNYKIALGLDLSGGSQLLLEADAADAAKQRIQGLEDSVTTELRRGSRIEIGDISSSGGRLSFLVRDPTRVDDAVERMRALSRPVGLTGTRDWDVGVVDLNRVVLTPTAAGSQQALRDAMTVARDVVRRRID
ncbi:MAG: protein translocase subunit SecD, partial [Sphingomonas sp.]|nr:protein translocase subunit SecD [Sphingomonas sp.]